MSESSVATETPLPSARVNPYDKIRDAIVVGELTPGQPLVESALASWCGVSRTPIREALRRLEQDGLISWTERGLVVRERSPEEILDIYEVRIVLEASCARIAAERRTDHDLRMMRAALEQSGSVDTGDKDDMVRSNRAFHKAMLRAAHNESLADLLDRLNLQLTGHADTQPTIASPGRWDISHAEHVAMVDAIEARDGDLAAEIATRHFTEARDIRLMQFSAALAR